jgi:multidrug efflux system outer membrane protein
MKKNKITGTAFILLTLVLISCTALKDPTPPAFDPIPKDFTVKNNSGSNSGVLKPKDLFNDSNLILLIDSALRNNIELQQSVISIQQLEADVLESRSMLLPNLGAYAGYSNRKFGLQTMDGAGNITTTIGDGEIIPIHLNDFNLGLQTSWEIDVWGKLKARKKASLARLSANQEYLNMLKTTIVEQVMSNYFTLIVLGEKKRLLTENLVLNEQLVQVSEAQKEAARGNSLSVQQFQALSLNYKNQLVLIEQDIFFIENNLRQLIGRYNGEIKRSGLINNPLVGVELQSGLPAEVLNNRPDIKAAEKQIEAAKADVHTARAEFYPTISINGNIGYQAYRTRFLFSSPESIAYGLFGNLMAPLVNRGVLKANFKRASASQLEAYIAYQSVVLNAYTEINNGLFALQTSNELLKNKKTESTLLQEARNTAGELFQSNKIDYYEVLNVQQNAMNSQIESLELIQQQFIWKLYLYKALGGGWNN